MFNPSNYHWTEDLCTEEGIEKIKEHLKEESIGVEEIKGEVHRTQRMGDNRVRYDISCTLEKNGKKYQIEGFTSFSTEDEVEESPVKRPFLRSIEEMKKKILSSTSSSSLSKDSAFSIPQASGILRKEKRKVIIELNRPLEYIKHTLLEPSFVKQIGVGVEEDPLSYVHKAISLKNILLTDSTPSTCSFSALCSVSPYSEDFLVFFSLNEVRSTQLTISSSSVPINAFDSFTEIFQRAFLLPMGIPHAITK
ncbi:hypothetical protein NEFER03_2226 [Nematocida sp. LUAm3]|nr:hypothetical protein NEFER03_2226 [Nematocida sp. LUAm3]KAI5176360.1 hypothetical protein NEFER02_2138 [Nematocida sp. LUAm2]KAI5179386.1 hypothetical protein NEFER01_2218 [Nematocida sp. LUAm1]